MAQEDAQRLPKPPGNMMLRTKISAEFVMDRAPESPAEQAHLSNLNYHVEDCCERLQETFRVLIIQMLGLKQEAHVLASPVSKGGENNAGSDNP